MITQYLLSLEEFKSWLEAKEKNEVIGERCKYFSCPIANALKDKIGSSTRLFDVSVSEIETNVKGVFYENPDWVKAFINSLDSNFLLNNVTVEKALYILDNLHICTVCNKYNPEGKNCGKDNCDW